MRKPKLVLRNQVMPLKSQGWSQGGAKAQVSRLQVVLTLPRVGRFPLSWPSVPLPWDRICRIQSIAIWASQVALLVKNPPANVFDLWVRNIPWRRAGQPTPVFLPGESRGQRSLVGYSPWGHKESDMTKGLGMHQLFISTQDSAKEY